jgi:hypothetical protein
VTAMSIIDATTGLRAFTFLLNFLKFILFFNHPLGLVVLRSLNHTFKYYDLIHYIIDP